MQTLAACVTPRKIVRELATRGCGAVRGRHETRRRSVHLCVVGVEAIEQGLRLVAFVDSIDSLQQGQVRAFSEVVEEELTRFSFGAQPFVS